MMSEEAQAFKPIAKAIGRRAKQQQVVISTPSSSAHRERLPTYETTTASAKPGSLVPGGVTHGLLTT